VTQVDSARQAQERLTAGLRWQHWDLVFPSSIGTPLEPRNLVTRFKALLERTGLPDLRFHDLRHSCASLLIAQGVSPRVVMETLGHGQIGLTMNTYAHVLPEVQRQAASAMDALLSSGLGPAETA
jgi:integrase